MPNITDPVATKFINEELRPVAEALQSIGAFIASRGTRYTEQVAGTLQPHVAGDKDVSRAAEGVGSPSKADIQAFVTLLNAIGTEMDKPGNAALIDTFAVNPVRVRIDLR